MKDFTRSLHVPFMVEKFVKCHEIAMKIDVSWIALVIALEEMNDATLLFMQYMVLPMCVPWIAKGVNMLVPRMESQRVPNNITAYFES